MTLKLNTNLYNTIVYTYIKELNYLKLPFFCQLTLLKKKIFFVQILVSKKLKKNLY